MDMRSDSRPVSTLPYQLGPHRKQMAVSAGNFMRSMTTYNLLRPNGPAPCIVIGLSSSVRSATTKHKQVCIANFRV